MNCICSGILFADVACWPISHVPAEGELVTTEKIELNLGGCASNVALDLARLKIPTLLAGCVGDDALSDFIAQAVSVPGVDLSGLQRSPGRCPGTAMHLNVRDQDRRFVCPTGANDDFVFDDTLLQKIRTPDSQGTPKVLYLGGFFMLRSLENPKTPETLRLAQENGWTTIVDVVLNGQRSYWDILEPLLPYTDMILPNEHEGEKITGERDPYEQAKAFLGAGAKAAVITQGEGGTIYFSDREQFRAGVYPTSYVSGSGAGDAFCAGLIAALLEGLGPRDAFCWGSALGASSVRDVSTTGSVFHRDELLAFLDDHTLPIEDI